MSEDLNVFPNARSKFLGSDTHAASLSGASSADIGNSGGNSVIIGSTSFQNGVEMRKPSVTSSPASVTINVKDTNSKIVIAVFITSISEGSSGGDLTVSIQEDTVEIGTLSTNQEQQGHSQARSTKLTRTGIAAGNHTYRLIYTAINPQTSVNWIGGGAHIQVQEIELTDTHAANLTGANTQTTHEQAVSPA